MDRRLQRFRQTWEDGRDSKFFAADWSDILSRLAVWDALSHDTRAQLVHLKTGTALRASSLGEDLGRLERGDFLDVTHNRATARMSASAQPFFRLMRALERHDLIARHGERAFLDYLRDHFTAEERRSLASSVDGHGWGSEAQLARHVASEGWPRRFLDQGKSAFSPAASMGAATILVRWFLENPAFLPLRELPGRVPQLKSTALATGLRLCFERLLVFPTFVRPDRTVVVGLWPPVAKRLAEPPPAPPVAFDAEPIFEGAFLVDDMTAILVAASSEPLRVRRNDGKIFERTKAALEAQLAPLPDALEQPQWFSAAARIDRARSFLEWMKLLTLKRASTPTLRPGQDAADWLSLGDEARLRAVLDWLRAESSAPTPVDEEAIHKAFDDDVLYDEGLELDEYFMVLDDDEGYSSPTLVRQSRFYPASIARWAKPQHHAALLQGVQRAYASVATRSFTPILEFLTYHGRQANPLLSSDPEMRQALRYAMTSNTQTDEELEQLWGNVLGDFCYERLLPLGGVAIGAADSRAAIRLTSAGRYLLGLSNDLEYRSVTGVPGGAVIVQPNFEVVFTAPAPRAEAAIARYAERAGSRVGLLFRITRDSILAAAAAGLTGDQAIAALTEASSRPLPANVAREITGWFDESRHITLAPALLFRCPDAHTAARVLAAGGAAVRSVSDTVVELLDPTARTRLIKKLRGLAVFVDQRKSAEKRRTPKRSAW